MAVILKPKHSETPGAVPTVGQLADGEFAINTADKKIYQRVGGNIILVSDAVAAGAASISQTEVDFGATPLAEQIFTITDAGVSPASQILAQVAWEAPTGKDVDEIEMDDLQIRCKPASGSFDMFIRAVDGSYLADKFKINYLAG